MTNTDPEDEIPKRRQGEPGLRKAARTSTEPAVSGETVMMGLSVPSKEAADSAWKGLVFRERCLPP